MHLDNVRSKSGEPPRLGRGVEDAPVDDWMHALYVRHELKGPAVPENPLARLVADSPDSAMPPSKKAALAHMRSARMRALRVLFSRGQVPTPA
jgi:hypothetical protein